MQLSRDLTTSNFFLTQVRPSNAVNYHSPREIFTHLSIYSCRVSEVSPREQLSLLSRVSWEWHQHSLHIDTIVAYLNTGVLDLAEIPLRKHLFGRDHHLQIMACFVEVLYGVRSIESFTHIQNQQFLRAVPPVTSQSIQILNDSSEDNFESTEEDEPPKQVELDLKPKIEGTENRIQKNLTRLSSNGLKSLEKTDKETLSQLLGGIKELSIECVLRTQFPIPQDQREKLTNVTTLSIRAGDKENFDLKLKPLSKLSELFINIIDLSSLPTMDPNNFPALKKLTITSDHSPCTNTLNSELPKSLESVYFYKIDINSKLFNLSENLKSLVLEQVLGFTAEDPHKFPNLENFKISFNPRHPADRELFAFDMPNLKHLDIEAVKGFCSFRLNALGLQNLKINCPELQRAQIFRWDQLKSISIIQPLWLKNNIENNSFLIK